MDIRLDEIIDATLTDRDNEDIHTNIVGNHISQMCLFGIRKGVEFYPQEDITGDRKLVLEKLISGSKIELFLHAIWARMIGQGTVLFYLRPTKDFYSLNWYWKDQFEVFYSEDGSIMEKVIITYPFEVKEEFGSLTKRRWVRLVITRDEIRQGVYDHNPSLLYILNASQDEVVKNTLGVIPCIVVDNDPVVIGKRGVSDFQQFASQILQHNRLEAAILHNIEFFGSPTLITTRPEKQVIESASQSRPQYRGASTGSGFSSATSGMMSTRKHDYTGLGSEKRVKIKRVIGSVQPDERIGYIAPDPVTGDMNQKEAVLREMIRTGLGGVDENSISAGATAFEIKSLYGRAAATASRKAIALYKFGICKILELAIVFEEHLFIKSFEQVTQWDIEKYGPITKEVINRFLDGDPENDVEGQPIPPGVIGIRPQGDPKVLWRWRGPVFEDTPQDKQMASIVMRNMTEEGINTVEAFKIIYPDKTEAEINMLLGGVPFRRGQRIIGMIQQISQLQMALLQMPSSRGQPLGMFVGPALEESVFSLVSKLREELSRGENISSYEYPSILTEFGAGISNVRELQSGDGSDLSDQSPSSTSESGASSNELPYAGLGGIDALKLGWADANAGAATATAAGASDSLSRYLQRQRSTYGPNSSAPGAAAGVYPGTPFSPDIPTGYPAGAGPAQPGTSGNASSPPGPSPAAGAGVYARANQSAVNPSMGAESLRPEFIRPIPSPGATLASERTSGLSGYGGFGSNIPTSSAPVPGPTGSADLQRQPAVWRQLFPTAAAILDAIATGK